MPKTVVVGLSGGVDSSAAAVLLQQQGYDVIGVTMRHLPAETTNSCCSLEAIVDARRVAKKLGIPHYLVDVEQPFFEKVIQPFEEGYLAGTTPNPCALCNRNIKFGAMWDWSKSRGADYLATGHYVRVREAEAGYQLLRGRDHAKDQSYLMYTLNQADLEHLVFPVGEYSKQEARAIAEDYGLVTAHKPDSQELCFVPKNDYQGYLKAHRPEALKTGEIVDTAGRVVGQHEGIAFYTIGQRRGIGVAFAEPHYVVALDAQQNRVVVGLREDVETLRIVVEDTRYVGETPDVATVLQGAAKIRYNMDPREASWEIGPDAHANLAFDEPQWASSPGQVAALYRGEVLLGGGKIIRTPHH